MVRVRFFSLLALSFVAACSSSTSPSVAAQISSPSGGQFAQVGSALPVRVSVKSSTGAPVSGVVVTWAKVTSTGALAGATSTTDATGSASMTWTVDTLIGVKTISATVAGIAPITIAENVTVGAAARFFKVSGDSQTVALHGPLAPLVFGVADKYGNPVAGALLSWNTPCNWDAFNIGLFTTDSGGHAAVTATFGGTAGVCTVTGITNNIVASAVTFTVTGH
jgi:hypothetical protein